MCSRIENELSFPPTGKSKWSEGHFFGAVLGGSKVTKSKSIFAKTRVGFGRTELSLILSCTEFCALSSGHGPRGRGFEGFCKTLDFHHLWEVENRKKHENAR